MKFKYVPKLVTEKGWKGSVTVNLMTFDQRMDLADVAAGLTKDESGLSYVKFLRQLINASKVHYVEVDLTRSDGEKASSVEDLFSGGKACHDVLQEVALGLMNGFEEGNLPAPSSSK